ncbi:uncharacterized protein SOCG_01872 [Schizosaccharomyces octosporus yFS286]|uniref:Uncharacterized protein n=1 Tax=Schizosaccharomyces octosporus (strain yFS286) TaxID=483514 RepID=S9PUK9_SCHOY|nr:uncharacterized protein SOCG_01872 [Schizosaccharomyces octosporus yFS286]EPX71657.1 hypothetical protein SOCG_01872 [Schizosaccharomyces octosporus yFS286]
MKNKYTSVSDSEESLKTLNDEKSDTRSSEGTPPPYSASNKFIDLEMADGSAQNSAELSENNIRSDPSPNKQWWKTPVIGTVTIITILYNLVFLAIIFGYKVSPYSIAFYWLAAVSIGTIFIFLLSELRISCSQITDLFLAILVTYPEWYREAGRATKKCIKKSGRATKKCIYPDKFEWSRGVCFEISRRLRIYTFSHGVGCFGRIEHMLVCSSHSISRNRPPRNEETELQPLADQSSEV